MSSYSASSSERSANNSAGPTEPTVPRLRVLKWRARARRSSHAVRAASASGRRSSRFQRIPDALRDELTATDPGAYRGPQAAAILNAMHARWLVWSAALIVGTATGVGIAAAKQTSSEATPTIPMARQAANPRLDPGTPLNAVAPSFKLTDQFGNTISLRHYRAKVVILSFVDPQCTTICPLTTTAMVGAKRLIAMNRHVQLMGISANPKATQVKWVRAYSQTHGLMKR